MVKIPWFPSSVLCIFLFFFISLSPPPPLHSPPPIVCVLAESELNHQEFQREVQMLKCLRHPHLISLFATCTASAPYYIITELMEKGSLLTFLRGRNPPLLPFLNPQLTFFPFLALYCL